jgi:hypothetical protein
MTRRLGMAAALAITAVGLLGLPPAGASADTVVMGSTLANNYDGGVSGGAHTVSAQISFDPVTSPNPVVSPVDGVITDWKVKSADDGAIYTLKVLRPNGPVNLANMTKSNFTGVTSVQAPSAVPAGTFLATPTGVIFDYPASLPISKGDYVGLLTGGDDDDLPQAMTNGLSQNLIGNNFDGQPTDGASADLLSDMQHDLLLQATIEFTPTPPASRFCRVPDVRGLTLAAAQQAIAAADCTATVSKKKLKRNKKNRKKKGKVLNESLPPGTTAPPGTAVDLKVAALQKKKKEK